MVVVVVMVALLMTVTVALLVIVVVLMTVVVVLLVIMLMVMFVVFLAFVPVDGCHPRRRSHYLLKVKGFGVEEQYKQSDIAFLSKLCHEGSRLRSTSQ